MVTEKEIGRSKHYRKIAILLVDDNPNLLDIYSRCLNRQDLRTAVNKQEARAHLHAGFVPDVALVDNHLGNGAYGSDVLMMIRDRCPDARRILLTGIIDGINVADMYDLAHLVIDKTSPVMGNLLRELSTGVMPGLVASRVSNVMQAAH